MCIFSGRFDAVEDLFLIPNLPSAARRVYSRSAPLKNKKKYYIYQIFHNYNKRTKITSRLIFSHIATQD